MWDFSIGRGLSMMARTWPFIVFRLVVYFGIAVAYVLATGVGAAPYTHLTLPPSAPGYSSCG
ncbi:hypothetical protein VE25_00670, partial [Devosia geojensis]